MQGQVTNAPITVQSYTLMNSSLQFQTPTAVHPTAPNYSKDTTTLIIPGLWMRELNPDLPDEYFEPPANTKADNI